MVAAVAAVLAGCGKSEKEVVVTPVVEEVEEKTELTADDPEEGRGDIIDDSMVATEPEVFPESPWGPDFYPSNKFEERVGQIEFDSYDEIIGLLNSDEAYAYATIKGIDEPVLLVGEEVFDNGDGTFASLAATPYSMKSNGKITADSIFTSGGTGSPIKIDDDGIVWCASHHSIEEYCYGKNGTDNVAIMMMASVYTATFDDNGDAATVGGFIRTENTVLDNDGEQIGENDVEVLSGLFDKYNELKPIEFKYAE